MIKNFLIEILIPGLIIGLLTVALIGLAAETVK